MPRKSDLLNVTSAYDRRRKLTDKQRDEIKHKYGTGFYSLNGLAKEYNVSKKTILLVVNPESKRKNDERIKDHWHDYVPTKEERNAVMREHRAYKKKLFKEGKIK